ncbi:MAG: FecR domain-containing protein [Sandaracinaceae bacterium]
MTGPLEQLPVEPLSEETWSRIEERVLSSIEMPPEVDLAERYGARARHEGRWAYAVTVGSVVLAAAALVVALLAPEQHRESVSPLVSHRMLSGDATSQGMLGDITLALDAHTALTAVGGEGQGWLVALESGAAEFAVPPQEDHQPFVVHAGDVRAEVIGTRFRVERRGDSVRIAVSEGVVRVTERGETVRVGAGDAFRSRLWPRGERGSAEPEATSEAAIPSEGAEATQEEPKPDGVRRSRGPTSEGRARSPHDGLGGARPPAAAESERARFERASRLEATDPASARTLYLEVVEEGGPWAANALFAVGRLAADRGRVGEARRALTRYLTEHPDGPNAEDARALLARFAEPARP